LAIECAYCESIIEASLSQGMQFPSRVSYYISRGKRRALFQEKPFMLSHRQTLEEDLNDDATCKTQLEDASITELRMSLEAALTDEEKQPD
jgi:hypothetical protein